jgi:hypothetical protein
MTYLPDEHYTGNENMGPHYRAHAPRRRHDPHCHLQSGMSQVEALQGLQALVSQRLKTHIPLGSIGFLAQATGYETPAEIAQALHISRQRVTAHRREIYGAIIPLLKVMRRDIARTNVGLSPLSHD